MNGSPTEGIKTVLHPVSDLEKAKAVYAALLGVSPQNDDPYYVGFEAEVQHIGLVRGGGPQGMTSPVAYWHVSDIEAKLAEFDAIPFEVRKTAWIIAELVQTLSPSAVLAVLGYTHLMARGDR